MQSGVIYGLLGEIDGIVARYSEKYGDLKVILCGGDTRFLKTKLIRPYLRSLNWFVSGLNSILIYNVNR